MKLKLSHLLLAASLAAVASCAFSFSVGRGPVHAVPAAVECQPTLAPELRVEPPLSYAAAVSALTLEPLPALAEPAQGPGSGPLATCGCTAIEGPAAFAGGYVVDGCETWMRIRPRALSPGICHKVTEGGTCNHKEQSCFFTVDVIGQMPAGWHVDGGTSSSPLIEPTNWQLTVIYDDECGPMDQLGSFAPKPPCGETLFVWARISPPAGSPALDIKATTYVACHNCGQ